jgi:hypothetical protein
MGVIRHWRWSALGASGVALLLPVGLAIGVAFTTALGGGTTIRALGQVIAGPAAAGPSGGSAPGSAGRTPARRRTPAGRVKRRQPASRTPARPSRPTRPTRDPTPDDGPPRTPVHETGQAVSDAVSALPGPAGQVAGDVTQSVVDLIP